MNTSTPIDATWDSSSVPIDTSWDVDSCKSYNPEKYILNNLIIRTPAPKLSKQAKKNFRDSERIRFKKIEEMKEAASTQTKEATSTQTNIQSSCVMMCHLNGDKSFSEFSDNDLSKFSLQYIIQYIRPYELLEIFGRLPMEYQQQHQLRILIPCFSHYGTETSTSYDGPPSSQKNCVICKNTMIKNTVPIY